MPIKGTDYFPIYFLGILSGVILSIVLLVSLKIAPEALGDVNLEYTDLVVIILASVTVVVTILAVFIAVLAIWGYSQFERMTKKASETHLEKMLADGPFAARIDKTVVDHVSNELKDGALREILTERVDRIIITDAAHRDKTGGEQPAEQPYDD